MSSFLSGKVQPSTPRRNMRFANSVRLSAEPQSPPTSPISISTSQTESDVNITPSNSSNSPGVELQRNPSNNEESMIDHYRRSLERENKDSRAAKQFTEEAEIVLNENKELRKTLEALQAEAKILQHEKSTLQEQIKSTFDDFEKKNQSLKRDIEDLTFRIEASKKEKKALADRLSAVDNGLVHPLSSIAVGSFIMPAGAMSQIPIEDGIVWELKSRLAIKAGTTEKLVSKLYSPSDYHSVPEYVTTFLLTYRSFMSPKQVLQLLTMEYNESVRIHKSTEDEAVKDDLRQRRIRICNFIKRWVESFYHDFERDAVLVDAYHTFIQNVHSVGDTSLANLIEKSWTKKIAGESLGRSITLHFSETSPSPIVPAIITIEYLEPIEIARQLTSMEGEMFRAIAPKELLALSWTRPNKESLSPNVLKMIRRFNDVSCWVSSCLVSEPNVKKRQQILKKFIKTAEECLKLNNFNAIFEITSGLTTAGVYRLAKTWEPFRAKTTFFHQQEKITANKFNFKYYKELLKSCCGPCIPYLGVYLSMLTFIEEGNKDVLDNDSTMVNFFKRRLVAEVIKEIIQYQQAPYNLVAVPSIVNYLNSQEKLEDSEIFKLSLQIEPRE